RLESASAGGVDGGLRRFGPLQTVGAQRPVGPLFRRAASPVPALRPARRPASAQTGAGSLAGPARPASTLDDHERSRRPQTSGTQAEVGRLRPASPKSHDFGYGSELVKGILKSTTARSHSRK